MHSKKNLVLALNLALLGLGMLMLAFASVPLYRLFCQATGYEGTPRKGGALPRRVLDRTLTVEFNAETSPRLAWEFWPERKSMRLRLGQQAIAYYTARNRTDRPLTGHAVYNVVPFSAGQYFVKIQCFCFKEQTLAPHASVRMPVLFYVDPALASDHDMNDVQTITLSYTFFPVKK